MIPAEAINEALRLTTSQIYRNELEIDQKYRNVGSSLIGNKMTLKSSDSPIVFGIKIYCKINKIF